MKADLKPCPTCKDVNFELFYNKGLQQSLYDFQVYCTHKSKGCEWTGELRKLDNHLNSADKYLQGCAFTLIKCPLNCETKLTRQDIPSHLKDKSLHPEHTLVELVMTGFEQHRKDDDIWYSPGFYTHPGGYKMCLAIYANRWAEGRSKYIAVYVHLMQGEFDDKLEWPFRGDVHVQLLSWEEGGGNSKEPHTKMIPFDESAQECTAGRVVGGERAELGRGLCKFASHGNICAKYLKKNCLKVCVFLS